MPPPTECSRCGTPLPGESSSCPGCLLLDALEGEERSPLMPAEGLPVVPNYEISRKLGEGGSSVVYLARQRAPVEREVAFKLIKAGMDTDRVVARFEAERQVLALLQHPAIATVLDAGRTAEGRPYFVMEHVDGLPVTEFATANSLPLFRRLELFIEICEAVQHAHQKGIVHRDLKPSNILVTASEQPKVIDFGIARALGGDLLDQTLFLTREGEYLGTPAYMSPEQSGGKVAEIDTRSDVYSLGVLLYELLTGRLPDPPTGDTTVVRPSRVHTTTTVRETSLRGDLDWIILRALEHDKERRYHSPAALADDLRRHLFNEPVSAGPPTAGYRLRKFARRHRGIAAGTVVATIAILTGLCTSLLLANVARKNAALARAAESRAASEAAVANAVNEFLIDDLLNSVDVENATNPNITVLETVDRAASTIDERFGELPRVATAIHQVIGNTYQSLGRYDDSFDHFARGLEYLEKIPHHSEAAKTRRALVRGQSIDRFRQRRLEESRKLLEQFLELARKDGMNSAELVPARMQLASQLALEGKALDSIKLQKELIAEIESQPEPDQESLRQTRFNLALNLYNVGQPEEAIPLLEGFLDSLESVETLNGTSTMTELAAAYQAVGRVEDAEKQLLRARSIQAKILSPDHPQRVNTLARLASLWDENGKVPEAIELYRHIIATGLTEDSQGREQAIVALHNLALVLMETDLPEAETLMRRAVEERRELFGPDNYLTVSSLYNLGLIYRYQEKFELAESTFREVITKQSASLGPGYPDTLWTTRVLAHLLFDLDRPDEARELAKKVLDAPLPEQPGLAEMVKDQQERTRQLLEQYK